MLDILNDLIWSKILIIMLIGLGLYFTIASRFVQFRYFSNMFNIFGEAFQRTPGQISSFQALMLSVAGRVGAGNIAGGLGAAILMGSSAVCSLTRRGWVARPTWLLLPRLNTQWRKVSCSPLVCLLTLLSSVPARH